MRTKRLFAALLAACLSLTLALPCAAAGDAGDGDAAVQAMTALGILTGDSNGNLNLHECVYVNDTEITS